jgi:hypothetical protein
MTYYALYTAPGEEGLLQSYFPDFRIVVPERVLLTKKAGVYTQTNYPVFKGVAFLELASDADWEAVKNQFARYTPLKLKDSEAAFIKAVMDAGGVIRSLAMSPGTGLGAGLRVDNQLIKLLGDGVKVEKINKHQSRLLLNFPFLGTEQSIFFAFKPEEGKDLNKYYTAKRAYSVKLPAGFDSGKFWLHEFGDVYEARDFAGRQVRRDAYGQETSWGWGINRIAVEVEPDSLENLEIENVETIRDREYRNVFWVGTKRYAVVKLHRAEGLPVGGIAPYPYTEKDKRYCIAAVAGKAASEALHNA